MKGDCGAIDAEKRANDWKGLKAQKNALWCRNQKWQISGGKRVRAKGEREERKGHECLIHTAARTGPDESESGGDINDLDMI